MKLRKVPYLLFIIVTICLITSCNKECKHQSTDWIIDKQATCTEDGSKHKECTVCHEKLVTEVIESLGHDLVHHEKEDPTCTENGHKAYDACTKCDYTTYEELPATGHTESDWIIDKQATCTENGSKHKECTKCHEKLDTEVIEALGHNLVHHEKEDPTCTNKGHKAYDTCTRCDYTTYEEIPELGHIYEDGICTRCGLELTTSDLLYELASDNTGYLVTGIDYSKYDINATTIIIPNEYRGLPVIGIKKDAFIGREKIKKIFLPDTITYIGESAFSGCIGLTSIEIPNSVISICKSAFEGCNNLTSMTLPFIGNGSNETHLGYIFGTENSYYNSEYVPKSLKQVIITIATSIGHDAFYDCTGLTSIEIPSSVTSIGYGAFIGCIGLTSIEIPNSVISIGGSAFRGCTGLSLTNVYYKGTIEDWCNISFKGFEYNNHSSYSNPMQYASHFYMLDENSEYNEITEIVIPETVTKIGNYQFKGFNNITNIIISNSVKSIGLFAFEECTNLASITLPFIGNGSDKTHLGYIFGIEDSYYNSEYVPTSLKKVIITNAKSIGIDAFYGCTGLTSIEIPNSVTSIGEYAFSGCTGLTSIEIPNSVTSIGAAAFGACTNLTIYCVALEKPRGWNERWNSSNCKVVWGYKKN